MHNSARFPYVSPAGVVMNKKAALWDRLGDGGYVEASGTLTIGAVLARLKQENLIHDELTHEGGAGSSCPLHPEDRSGFVDHGDCSIAAGLVKVIVLDNAPTGANGWLCDAAENGPGTRAASFVSADSDDSGIDVLPIPDVVAPVQGTLSTRAGRGGIAQYELLRMAGDCGRGNFAELRFPRPLAGRPPAMDWMLDAESRRLMDAALATPAADAHLAANVERIRQWLGAIDPASPTTPATNPE